MKLPCGLQETQQKRPYVMDTGWTRGMHDDMDGEALCRWAKQLEADIEQMQNTIMCRRLTVAEFEAVQAAERGE